jgi:hypothetical protein
VWGILRLGPPALAIYLEVSIGRSPAAGTTSDVGILSAAGFVLAAVGSAAVLTETGSRFRSWPERFVSRLSSINALLSVLVVALLVVVSASTAVTLQSTQRIVHYSWFPWWLGLPLTAAVLAGVMLALGRARESRRVERAVLLGVVAPVLLILLTAGIPGALGNFIGFDDAQAMVGARLMFQHGLWPWRDVFLLHGFLADGLYGAAGMWVLSPTRWGSDAGISLIVTPLTWIALFAFVAYFSRRRNLIVVGAFLAMVLGLVPAWGATRYALVPLVLVLFDLVLRNGTWGRCALFISGVVVVAIVVPEATILLLGVVATLIFSDLVRYLQDGRVSGAFERSLRSLAVGSGLICTWLIFLAATGTIRGFVGYYRATISGHQYWGPFRATVLTSGPLSVQICFFLPVALYLLTVTMVVVKLLRRSRWETTDWVLVASGTFVPLFYQVAIDRLDVGHVLEVFEAVTPFVLLWGIKLASLADAYAMRTISRAGLLPGFLRLRADLRAPVAAFSIVAIALWAPTDISVWHRIPSKFHPQVANLAATMGLPFGYLAVGVEDVKAIADLRVAVDWYAGSSGPVFDFANEMGITYFLLSRVPGARFYHVESAETPQAQEQVISDLRHSRPKVVIFYENEFGLSVIDGIVSPVRNYLISEYLVDNYRPVIDVDGQLLMLRDDLRVPPAPPPRLFSSLVKNDFFYQMPGCGWGDVPNFFPLPSASEIRDAITPVVASDQTRQAEITSPSSEPEPASTGIVEPARDITLAVPRGGWSRFKWLELESPIPIGDANVVVTDSPLASLTHQITFTVLPRSRNRVYVRVGSCLQWHGYPDTTISVLILGGPSALTVRVLP